MKPEALFPDQLAILQHAYGADQYGRGGGHRRVFCAGGNDVIVCAELVTMGLMRSFGSPHLPYFNCIITDAGVEAMRQASPAAPKRTRAQLRYRRFLSWRDAFGGTFREFLVDEKRAIGGLLDGGKWSQFPEVRHG